MARLGLKWHLPTAELARQAAVGADRKLGARAVLRWIHQEKARLILNLTYHNL